MIAKLNTNEVSKWWLECEKHIQKSHPSQSNYYLFGQSTALIKFYQSDNLFFTQAIAHLEIHNQNFIKNNFLIHVIDGTKSGIVIPLDIIIKYKVILDNNHYVQSEDINYVLHYQFGDNFTHIQIINKLTNQAIVWCNVTQQIPSWEKSFPFRQILHHFFERSSYCLIHAAGVGIDGSGVILTAKGGSGKSTSALSCLEQGWQYIGDDFILLDTANNYMYSLYNVAKLEKHQINKFNNLSSIVEAKNQDMQKQQIFLYPKYNDKICHKMKLNAILIPEYDQNLGDTTLIKTTAAHALLSMAPSTMFLLKSEQTIFNKLSQICRSLPCYKLNTSKNLISIPRAIQELL